jgi:hypothetical protein
MPLIKDVKLPNSPQQARVQTAAWVLIYAGLLILLTGVTLSTMATEAAEGWQTSDSLMLGGGVLTALGAVLIYVRSRME